MSNPYVWPYYLPQQQQPQQPPLYFQFPPPASPGAGHRPSRSWQGSPHFSPPVLPALLPMVPAPAAVAMPSTPVAAAPVYPTYLHPGYTHSRRNSIDNSYLVPPPNPWQPPPAPYYSLTPGWAYATHDLPHPQLHNLLNGEVRSHHVVVDFSNPELHIRVRTAPGPGHLTPLGSWELEQPASHPQMARVRIVCDTIPQWPVDLHVVGTTLSPHRRRRAPLPFLTLEDIMHAIHSSLHRKITHEEWGRLTFAQETEVARAYTRRYKASSTASAEREQQREGVKRIDFLLKNCYFKGLVWLEPENGVERLRLLVGTSS